MDKDDLQKLRKTLDLKLPDLDATYTAFREETGKNAFDDFLSYLHEKDIIDGETLCKAHAEGRIEISETPGAGALLESMRYDLFHVIAEGAMGKILLGKDRDLRRKVAVKVLKKDLMSSPAMKRFIAEAQVTAQLDHPNIIPVYSLEIDPEGSISFAMKLIMGKTLKDLLEESCDAWVMEGGPDRAHLLPSRLEVFLRVCDAMSYAHSKGVIHMDLKPSNVMIGEFREVYVMDWGVARLVRKPEDPDAALSEVTGQTEDRDTGGRQVVGTPRYMSPEQARGEIGDLDQRSDLYALGLILFELVTLRPARTGTGVEDILESARQGKRQAIAHRFTKTRIPPELKAIIAKATERRPEDRYKSVRELADDVRHYLRGEEVMARPDTFFHKILRWMARHRQLTLFIVLAAIAVSAVVDSWVLYAQKAAVQAARVREARLSIFQTAVATRAHYIDSQFLRFQGTVVALADMASYLLASGVETDVPVYSCADLKREGRRPDGMVYAAPYRLDVCFDHASCKLAPGVTEREVRPLLRRIAPLSRYFRKALVDSRLSTDPLQPEDELRLLSTDGVPIRWAYVGLAEGVFFCFPGSAEYPEDYDPRVRPWYKRGESTRGAAWDDPYVDIEGQDIVLSCVASIHDGDDRFRGVAAIDLTFDWIIEALLSPAGWRGVEEAVILDEEGRVIISSSQLGAGSSKRSLPQALDLDPFRHEPVVNAVRSRESGHVEIREGKRVAIVVYYRLPALGWYYVEQAALAELPVK